MKTEFQVGDRVRVVKYGHFLTVSRELCEPLDYPIIEENETTIVYDLNRGLVGCEGIIEVAENVDGVSRYCIHGIEEKHGYYMDDQLELINK